MKNYFLLEYSKCCFQIAHRIKLSFLSKEPVIEKLEAKIDCGQIEEVILQVCFSLVFLIIIYSSHNYFNSQKLFVNEWRFLSNAGPARAASLWATARAPRVGAAGRSPAAQPVEVAARINLFERCNCLGDRHSRHSPDL